MKLSVIIPMYNSAPYITRCLESLVDQELDSSSYEILVVDDGSTDDSLQVVNKLANKIPNISVFTIENSGVSTARNFGIEKAQGKYLFFLDSDDIINPKCFGHLIDLCEFNDLDALGFRQKRIKIEHCVPSAPNFQKEMELEVYTGVNYLLSNNYYRDSSAWFFVKRATLEAHKIRFSTRFHIAEDLLFNIDLFTKLERVAFLDELVYHYINTPDSAWNSRDHELVVRKIHQFIEVTQELEVHISNYDNQLLRNKLKHKQLILVRNCMKRIVESDLNNSEVRTLLNEMAEKNLYPIKPNFGKVNYTNLKSKLVDLSFENKNRFILLLPILRKII